MTGRTLDRLRLERLMAAETAAFERPTRGRGRCSSAPRAPCSTASR